MFWTFCKYFLDPLSNIYVHNPSCAEGNKAMPPRQSFILKVHSPQENSRKDLCLFIIEFTSNCTKFQGFLLCFFVSYNL